MSNISIIHVISGLHIGGAEMMLFKLLSRTDLKRFNTVVISLTDRGPIGEQIEYLGIPVYSLNIKFGVSGLKGIYRLVRTVRQINPDILQGWMYHGNLAAQIGGAFLSYDVPILWNIRHALHQPQDEKLWTKLVIWLTGKLSGLPAKIINNSSTSALQHEQYLCYRIEKKVIIPNGFDTEMFTPSELARTEIRSELGLSEDTLLIGMVGRYHPVKDHANFLQAAALLLEMFPNVHFVLVGRGVDQTNNTLMQLITDLGISAHITLLGERPDVPKITAALDIATSSSYSESFPNVVGEAMSCGIPCVVTDVGDSANIVGETGVVVPPRNFKALAYAWHELISLGFKNRRNLGISARERIVRHFSLNSIVAQYEELYEKIHAKTRGKEVN